MNPADGDHTVNTGASSPEPRACGYVGVDGGRIWYRVNGEPDSAKVPLLVIHGGPGMSHHYLLPFTDLADERPVILYDQLDCGNADRPDDPANWRVERFVAEVDAVRTALDLQRVCILGNSWGGTIAAEYAITKPGGLVGLVLSSPLLSAPRWVADNAIYRRQLPARVREVLDEHEAGGTTHGEAYQAAVGEFYSRHFNRMQPWPPELGQTFDVLNSRLYESMWGNTEFNATGTLKRYDATARLGCIETPTLYACGEFDESTPAACEEFCALTPEAELEIVADSSHTAFLERRAHYMSIVRRFLASLGC